MICFLVFLLFNRHIAGGSTFQSYQEHLQSPLHRAGAALRSLTQATSSKSSQLRVRALPAH